LTLLRNSPWHHQAFVAVVVVQCAFLLAERAWLFSVTDLSSEAALRQAVYFLLVLCLSALFVLYFAVHSVLQANAFETAAFIVASLLLLARLAAEYFQRSDECATAGAQLVCAGFLGASLILVFLALGFTVSIYRDLAWKRYKAIGAEVATREMYQLYEIFSAVRKLDVQFSLITLITGLVFLVGGSGGTSAGGGSGGAATAAQLAANVLLFAVELAWERLGDAGIKGESPHHLWAFWALSPLLPCFIVAIAADALTNADSALLARAATGSLRYTIAAMGALAILNRLATVACSAFLYRNFGPRYVGLRRIIMSDRKVKFNSRKASYARDAVGPPGAGAGAGFGASAGAGAGTGGAGAGAASAGGTGAGDSAVDAAAAGPAVGAGAFVGAGAEEDALEMILATGGGGPAVVVANVAALAAGGSGPGRPGATAAPSLSAAAAAAAAARADRVAQLAGARRAEPAAAP
jgi:hypothetical protein